MFINSINPKHFLKYFLALSLSFQRKRNTSYSFELNHQEEKSEVLPTKVLLRVLLWVGREGWRQVSRRGYCKWPKHPEKYEYSLSWWMPVHKCWFYTLMAFWPQEGKLLSDKLFYSLLFSNYGLSVSFNLVLLILLCFPPLPVTERYVLFLLQNAIINDICNYLQESKCWWLSWFSSNCYCSSRWCFEVFCLHVCTYYVNFIHLA